MISVSIFIKWETRSCFLNSRTVNPTPATQDTPGAGAFGGRPERRPDSGTLQALNFQPWIVPRWFWEC